MAMPTPQQYAKNWARGMAGSGDKLRAGVQGVTENPAAKAAMAIDRQVQGVIRAAQDGTTAAGLGRVTLQGWQKDMIEKGIPRIAAGAATAEPKVAQFAAEFIPYLQAGMAQLPPRGGLEENLQRASSMARHNAAFRRNR